VYFAWHGCNCNTVFFGGLPDCFPVDLHLGKSCSLFDACREKEDMSNRLQIAGTSMIHECPRGACFSLHDSSRRASGDFHFGCIFKLKYHMFTSESLYHGKIYMSLRGLKNTCKIEKFFLYLLFLFQFWLSGSFWQKSLLLLNVLDVKVDH
jgi:hypothetical protein